MPGKEEKDRKQQQQQAKTITDNNNNSDVAKKEEDEEEEIHMVDTSGNKCKWILAANSVKEAEAEEEDNTLAQGSTEVKTMTDNSDVAKEEEIHMVDTSGNKGKWILAADSVKEAEEEEEEEEEVHMVNDSRKKKKKRKVVFPYGNYHRYYGYRVGKTLKQDPRMELMQTQWFRDKDVLDVGCNEGHVTIALAQKYHVRSMCGVDIDSGLIFRAGKNLQTESGVEAAEVVPKIKDWSEYVNENGTENDQDESFNPVAMEDEVELVAPESLNPLSGKELLERVQFKNVNFLRCSWRSHICDTVLCLSVAKWIHLNWGDEGLIQLFVKIYRLLRPGGVLILEPQPWKSYEKKKWVSEVARENFRTIVLRPDYFSAILLDKIGFKSCMQITRDVPDSSAGFSRPLFLYTK